MSLNSLINRNNYIGNNATSSYSYTFKILKKQDLSVIVREISSGQESILSEGDDFTVSGVKNVSGGSISLVNDGQAWLSSGSLSSNYTITLIRTRELKQLTDIKNQGDFYPEIHEDAFDGFVMNDQYLQDQISRSAKLPTSIDPALFNMDIPANLVGSANRSFITNDDGDGWELGPTADEIANAQAYADAAATSAANALASENALVNQINGTRGVPINVSASGIAFSGNQRKTVYFIQGNGGNVTVSSNPAILPGSVIGQQLILVGRNDAALVQFNDGNGLDLNGMCILGESSCLELMWDGVNWFETSRR